MLRIVVDRDSRVDNDNEFGAAVDGDVEMQDLAARTVNIVFTIDLVRPKKVGNGTGGSDRLTDVAVAMPLTAEDDPFTTIKIVGRNKKFRFQFFKAVPQLFVFEGMAEVLLQWIQ